MTVAYNLSQLANKVNSSGQLDASTGLVNSLPAISGANLTNLNASNLASGTVASARLSNGAVIQTVFGSASTATTTTSSSFVDATDCLLTITPTSSTSKILVNFSIYASVDAYSQFGIQNIIQIVRGSTVIGTTQMTSFGAVQGNNIPIILLDSPNTTSTLTYKVQFRRYVNYGSTSNFVGINQPSGSEGTSASFFCLQEIKGS